MWDTLALLSQGTEKIKENKLSVLMREFDALMMKNNESMEVFKLRVLNVVSTLATLEKYLSYKEINLKVVCDLTVKWQNTKENCLSSRDLGVMSHEALFSDFKALEFDLNKENPVVKVARFIPVKGLGIQSHY